MQCINCNNEVLSKFTHAIATNCCPFCGDAIMPEQLQKVLSGLQAVMAEAADQSYDVEALNWVSSNFNLVSRTSEEFVDLQKEIDRLNHELQVTKDRFVKPTPKSGKVATEMQIGMDNEGHQVQLQGDAIQDPEVTQTFMNRASVSKSVNNNEHFKKMVSQIKKGGTVEGGGMGVSSAQLAAASPEEIEAMEEMLAGGAPVIASGIDTGYDDDDALPPIAEAFIAGGTGKQTQDYNPRDIAKLQQLQQKSARASRALDGGGSVGLIRR